jgi:replication-associated recombination protein RarA
MSTLLNKYRPTHSSMVIGSKSTISIIRNWLINRTKKALLLSGPCGIGKSLIIDLLVKETGYNPIEISCDELASLQYSSFNTNIANQHNIIIIDYIDSADESEVAKIVKCIKTAHVPIILICNDRYSKFIKPLVTHCLDVKMKPPTYVDIQKFINTICKLEKIKVPIEVLDPYYIHGDVRSLLLAIDMRCYKMVSVGEQLPNVFQATDKMLSQLTDNETKARLLLNDPYIMLSMIHGNYINNLIGGAKELVNNYTKCASMLSDTDILYDPYNAFTCILGLYACHTIQSITYKQPICKKTCKGFSGINQLH